MDHIHPPDHLKYSRYGYAEHLFIAIYLPSGEKEQNSPSVVVSVQVSTCNGDLVKTPSRRNVYHLVRKQSAYQSVPGHHYVFGTHTVAHIITTRVGVQVI